MQVREINVVTKEETTRPLTQYEIDGYDLNLPEIQYPSEVILQDTGTGEPVKVMVKNGEAYVGGIDEEVA